MGKLVKTDEQLCSMYRCKKIAGRKIDTHRYIMEQLLGRSLASDEIVHHKDGNKLNNSLDNLEVMSRSEHTKLHMASLDNLKKLTREDCRKITKKAWEDGVYDHCKQAVASFDKVTGKLVKVYASIAATAMDGHEPKHVSSCCTGLRRSHHGYIWVSLTNTCKDLEFSF